jgi:hypothetical protein
VAEFSPLTSCPKTIDIIGNGTPEAIAARKPMTRIMTSLDEGLP